YPEFFPGPVVDFGELSAQRLGHIHVVAREQFRLTSLITQHDLELFRFAIPFYRNIHPVVRAVPRHDFRQVGIVSELYSVYRGNNVALADAGSTGGTVL